MMLDSGAENKGLEFFGSGHETGSMYEPADRDMTEPRSKILLDFAKWTALSALRSGAPIKSRMDVYRLLDAVAFAHILQPGPPISGVDFDEWHKRQTRELCGRDRRVPIGWGAKLINVFLKTAAYVGDLGRPNLRNVIHPPIDAGLWAGIAKRFPERRDILDDVRCVLRIKDIADYATYLRIVVGCRAAAKTLGCSLIEVEQLWQGAATPEVEQCAPPNGGPAAPLDNSRATEAP